MKKKNIVKDSKDFTRIIQKKDGQVGKYYIINIENNDDNIEKFGITFVKHIGNAVTRNLLKRRTKDIIDKNKNIYQKSQNYIIIIRKTAIDATYQELEKDLISVFLKIKEKINEEKK